jgi:hypothetical protein
MMDQPIDNGGGDDRIVQITTEILTTLNINVLHIVLVGYQCRLLHVLQLR